MTAAAPAGASATIADRIRAHARARPQQRALVQDDRALDYAALDALMDRVACALQRDGLRSGDAIAILAATSLEYAIVFLGALRAGITVAPLPPTATADSVAAMAADSDARLLFVDAPVAAALRTDLPRVTLDDSADGTPLSRWLAPPGSRPQPVVVAPAAAFNIIYSSGTTGTPKGIVQSHAMRGVHVQRAIAYGYGPEAITLLATPLYSNTTLVSFLPTLALGGTAVLMAKFDVIGYLELAQRERVTHTMLVPVQYQHLLAAPEFGRYDLSAFRMKQCTSAPFSAALKAEVLARWPGGLVEIYGMTEGGGTCLLAAHEFPHKLHTVGRPAPGHDIRVIDEQGRELAPGAAGEIVGHSPAMMTGYHKRPEQTRAAEWYDASGKRFIRTGDIGRFDADGFLVLLDRKKDMIISGGFNIYPSDLEAVLAAHPAVAEAAVVGVASERWGETPVAYVVPRPGAAADAERLLAWANERLGKTQRLSALRFVERLPRSAIGKVLKRELRARFEAERA
ncbi:MAG TPA: class I adenylate-forming enzyme family protein, partial [Burkholderiaceae bacterium]|nr:class I adenylate-forming enzyme family protein [Burkholderiaceae bacterium]